MTSKPLAASFFVLTLLSAGVGVGIAHAQTPMPMDEDPLDDRSRKRLDRMEKVVRELRSIVFQGRDTGKPVVVQPAETEGRLQALADRIEDLEASLTRLNGQNETVTFELDRTRKALEAARAESTALTGRLAVVEKRAAELEAEAAANRPTAAEVAVTSAQTPGEAFERARQFMLDGDYEAAERALGVFVEQYGDTVQAPEARYWLGKTQSARGANNEAAGSYIGAIRGWPKTAWAPDAVVELSRSLIALKKPADACKTLDELKTRYPKAPQAVATRAVAARAQAKCDA